LCFISNVYTDTNAYEYTYTYSNTNRYANRDNYDDSIPARVYSVCYR
jgi:hypothetical protein